MAAFRFTKKPFENSELAVVIRGHALPMCCGIYETTVGLQTPPTCVAGYMEALNNWEIIYTRLLDDFISKVFVDQSMSKSDANHCWDRLGPTFFVMTDCVPWLANLSIKEIREFAPPENYYSLLVNMVRPFWLARFIENNPKYGTIVKASTFRANGNYHRVAAPQKMAKQIQEGPRHVPNRHILNSWIWSPNQALVPENCRVQEYSGIDEIFSVYQNNGKPLISEPLKSKEDTNAIAPGLAVQWPEGTTWRLANIS